MNLEYGIGLNTVIKHVFHSDISTKSNFISYLAPKMYLYILIVYKKYGAEVYKFFGFYGFAKSDLYEMAFRISEACRIREIKAIDIFCLCRAIIGINPLYEKRTIREALITDSHFIFLALIYQDYKND